MTRTARTRYYDSVLGGDNKPIRTGDLVMASTNDTPEQSRIAGYPVWEVTMIAGTSVTGPELHLMPVICRMRSADDGQFRMTPKSEPRRMRKVRSEDQVEVIRRTW